VRRGPTDQRSETNAEIVVMSIAAPRVGIHVATRLTPGVKTGIRRPVASYAGFPAASSL
jgi:hypothetical protein